MRYRNAVPRPRHLPVTLVMIALVALVTPPAPSGGADGRPADAPALAHAHARDRVIVGFKPRASTRKRRAAVAGIGPASVEPASPISKHVVVVDLAAGRSVRAAIAQIGGMPGVAYVEPDYRVRPADTPDDPHYVGGGHWGMYGDDTAPHANRFGSGAGEAWARGHIGRSSTVVGVVDEGVRTAHPDLAENIWSNPWEAVNGVDDDGNGYVDDINGWDFYHGDASVYDGPEDDHGTHVAGTIGAQGGNGRGVAGVNWRVTLVPAKFMGPGGGYISDAVRALDYLTDLKLRHGLPIVATNNSWEGGGHSQALLDAIERAGDAGILFVAAAGNAARDIDARPSYPASYRCTERADGSPRGWDCVIAVANLQADGRRRSDSAWGSSSVDLGAPGTDIISTDPVGEEGYSRRTGTSMAASHVSGAAALCASVDPSLDGKAIRSAIMGTTVPTASLVDTASGGRLDIGALLERCSPPAPTPSPPLSMVTVDDLDPAFTGIGSGWNEGAAGHAGHHYWVPARESSKERTGVWRPRLPGPGRYEILVRIPEWHATTRRATYRVLTAAGWEKRYRNQYKRRGEWVSLGTFELTATPTLRLADMTGEASSLGRRIAYDAARFVPAPVRSSAR